jgi:hypothetical protein
MGVFGVPACGGFFIACTKASEKLQHNPHSY